MQFKRILSIGSIWVVFTVFISLFAGGDAWGQTINYTNQTMSVGSSQDLSASGGCPPYNWSLSGGGTLTPSGGDNTSATYVAPASNANCTDNPTITLTDCCRTAAGIQIAVNCYTGAEQAFGFGEFSLCYCAHFFNCNNCGFCYYGAGRWKIWRWDCRGNEIYFCDTRPNGCPETPSSCTTGPWGPHCGSCEFQPQGAQGCYDENVCWTNQCGSPCPLDGSCGLCDSRTAQMKNQGCCP